MPRLINIGSLCIDNVYQVPRFGGSGETLAAIEYAQHPGGKGLNQSLAAARAGLEVVHIGCIGPDGAWLVDVLASAGVDIDGIRVDANLASGHAVIQVTAEGENSIIITGGANRSIGAADLDRAFNIADPEDWLLIQNEINEIETILDIASRKGTHLAFNVAPADPRVCDYDLSGVELLIVNELEAAALTDGAAPDVALERLCERYPRSHVVLTCGADGLHYGSGEQRLSLPAFPVDAVDETAAGDAFIGYLMHAWLEGHPARDALSWGSAAGALATTQPGAATSIPGVAEVAEFLRVEAP